MTLTLGIDLGTSAVKVSLLDVGTGKCYASASSPGEVRRFSPQPGWVEQDPEDWWQATLAALRLLPSESLVDVRAIGISYQMHGLVLVDGRMHLSKSIIWADGRANDSGQAISDELPFPGEGRLLNHPGNFTLAKLRWVKENEPDTFRQAQSAFLPGDWLAWRLTGHASTTPGGLSEMIAWDFLEDRPSDEAWIAAAGDLKMRPEIVEALGHQGEVTSAVASETGLPSGVPVTYRAGDQPNNALSLGVLGAGDTAVVAGTSGVLYSVSDKKANDPENRINTFLHVSEPGQDRQTGVLMCVNGAGAMYSWVNNLLRCSSFAELNDLASESAPGADGLSCSPYGNGSERTLRGRSPGAGLVGIDLNRHSRAEIARATMEGIVFAMKFGADIMTESGAAPRSLKAGEGSMFHSSLFREIFASVFDAPLQVLKTDGAEGAARAAAVGAGLIPSLEQALSQVQLLDSVEPKQELIETYQEAYMNWLNWVHPAESL